MLDIIVSEERVYQILPIFHWEVRYAQEDTIVRADHHILTHVRMAHIKTVQASHHVQYVHQATSVRQVPRTTHQERMIVHQVITVPMEPNTQHSIHVLKALIVLKVHLGTKNV